MPRLLGAEYQSGKPVSLLDRGNIGKQRHQMPQFRLVADAHILHLNQNCRILHHSADHLVGDVHDLSGGRIFSSEPDQQ